MKNQLDERLTAVEREQHELKKRLSYLEGLVEGLRTAGSLVPAILPPLRPREILAPDPLLTAFTPEPQS